MINQLFKNGKAVLNHFVISDRKGDTLQSYNTLVTRVSTTGKITLSEKWDCSSTTCKYVCFFLSFKTPFEWHKKDVLKAIKDKSIKVVKTLA